MNYKKSMTATVYLYENEKVLLHIHKKFKTWFPIGGHLLQDEFPHEAAVREAREESGLRIKLVDTGKLSGLEVGTVEILPSPFLLYHEGGPDDTEEYLDFIYIATPISHELNPQATESSVFKWFDKSELQSDLSIKIHVRNTAIAIIDYMKQRRNDL